MSGWENKKSMPQLFLFFFFGDGLENQGPSRQFSDFDLDQKFEDVDARACSDHSGGVWRLPGCTWPCPGAKVVLGIEPALTAYNACNWPSHSLFSPWVIPLMEFFSWGLCRMFSGISFHTCLHVY